MALAFRVLGPFQARVDGEQVDVGGPRPRLLLARLIIARGATVSVDTLLEDIYEGAPPPRAHGTLHSYLSNLRKVLEPGRSPRTPSATILSRPQGYALGPHTLDAEQFADQAKSGHYDRALALWQGPPYEEFADVAWLRPEIDRLLEAHLDVREKALTARPDAEAAGQLESLAREHPLRETLWEALARTLYRLGRQADALEAIRTARANLAEELGIDPGPGLRRLESMILTQDPMLEGSPKTPREASGRDAQLDRLNELGQDVRKGTPRAAVISGEPGIGKTWLAEEFARRCEDDGWRVAWGRCHETSGTPPLWPWRQIIRDLGAEPGSELDPLVTDDPAPTGETEAGEARFRLHQATAAHLAGLAGSRPLLIVLDDLQWADSASLGLLTDFVHIQKRGRIAIIVTVRAGEGAPAVYDALGLISRDNALRLPLAGLGRDAVEAMAGSSGITDPGAVAKLAERTRGNPLFIRETLRLAEDRGIGTALTTVPEALGDVIRQRLHALPETHRPTLDAAAVIGHAADSRLLAEITGQDQPQVEEALEAATSLHLVNDQGRFAHELVREIWYADLPAPRRIALHANALKTLEHRPATDVASLARHAKSAGSEAAVTWSAATAEEAARRHAYDDAVEWWHQAADLHGHLPGADPRTHVELLLNLTRARLDAGDGYGARETRARAVLAADRTADPLLKAKALTSLDAPALWKFYHYGDIELHSVERIATILDDIPHDDSAARCRLLGCLGVEVYDGSADPRGDSATEEALAMARRIGDRRLLAITLNARYLGVQRAEMIPELDEIGAELTTLGLPGFELLGWLIQERTRLELFDLPGADAAAARVKTLIDRLDLPWPRFQNLLWSGARRQIDGDLSGAEDAYTAAAEAGERLNLWHTRSSLASALISLALTRRVPVEPADLIDESSPFEVHRRVIRALSARYSGQPEPGLSWVAPPRDFVELGALCMYADAFRRPHPELYRRLLPYEDRLSIGAGTFPSGPVGYFLALVAPDTHTRDDHLARTIERCAENGLAWWAERASNER
ncbi:AAA family ATPase [Herbidospora mongoliensis]|uniref:AAA family ATPase n=1 Tax=Herbidospora mongoliensis TaxID=688067 RepID=UPI00083484A8|nr:AAA family ATPase [Herbidospora mongoliensis]